jgi:hypothetical protein
MFTVNIEMFSPSPGHEGDSIHGLYAAQSLEVHSTRFIRAVKKVISIAGFYKLTD